MYNQQQFLKEQGFTGFLSIERLWTDSSQLPAQRGVYVVVSPEANSIPYYLQKGCGGRFKGKDPNVSTNILTSKWVKDCCVLYVGQAGGNGSNATIKTRVRQYLEFGKGKPVGHYGGRYIWQLNDPEKLLVAWKETSMEDPREVEKRFMSDFEAYYGKLPFANISR